MRQSFSVLSVIALAVAVLIYWPAPLEVGISTEESATQPDRKAFFQRMIDGANATGIDWQPAAFSIAVLGDAAAIPGISSCLAWREFTPDYVRGLYRRRAEMIAWTYADGREPLRVSFIGTIHAGGDPSPEAMADLLRSQAAVVDTVARIAPAFQVVTIEMSGADGALTWDRYMESANAAVMKYEGLVIDRSQVEPDMIAHPEVNGDVTLLRGTGFPSVIFGEEPTRTTWTSGFSERSRRALLPTSGTWRRCFRAWSDTCEPKWPWSERSNTCAQTAAARQSSPRGSATPTTSARSSRITASPSTFASRTCRQRADFRPICGRIFYTLSFARSRGKMPSLC